MLYTEFKLKDFVAVREKEAEARGVKKGEARGMKKGEARLLALLEKGVPLADAKRRLGISRNYAVR
jgi:hypothetical protein